MDGKCYYVDILHHDMLQVTHQECCDHGHHDLGLDPGHPRCADDELIVAEAGRRPHREHRLAGARLLTHKRSQFLKTEDFLK